MNWQIPETAPLDGQMILVDVGWPWPVVACWNLYEKKWVCPSLQINYVDGIDDPYFETELEPAIRRWMPLPEF